MCQSKNQSKNQSKARSTLKVVFAIFALTACSEDKSPPDDGIRIHNEAKTANCSVHAAAFRSCALEILAQSQLEPEDQEVLTSCNLAEASAQVQPKAASVDEFEAARSSVISHCF